jgi:hypothetical protein
MKEKSTEPIKILKFVLIILSRPELSVREEEVIEWTNFEIRKRLSFESFQGIKMKPPILSVPFF